MLLDVALPGEDGLSLARYVREQFDIGIIMVSGAGETVDRIIGLKSVPTTMYPNRSIARTARSSEERRAPVPARRGRGHERISR